MTFRFILMIKIRQSKFTCCTVVHTKRDTSSVHEIVLLVSGVHMLMNGSQLRATSSVTLSTIRSVIIIVKNVNKQKSFAKNYSSLL